MNTTCKPQNGPSDGQNSMLWATMPESPFEDEIWEKINMAIPQIPYDRKLLVEAVKSGAQAIIDGADEFIPRDIGNLRNIDVSINLNPGEVATIMVNFDLFPKPYVYPYRNFDKDHISREAD